MKKYKKITILITLVLICVVAITATIYAALTRTSARGEIEVTSKTVQIETTYDYDETTTTWEFNEAGDIKHVNVSVKNKSDSAIHRYYKVELAEEISTELASAILVYYNDEFVGTLAELNGNLSDSDLNDPYALTKINGTSTDKISFELHQSAEDSIFDGKSIKIKLTTYSENIDNSKYILVSSAQEFDDIMNDINSGLLPEVPTIIMTNDINPTKNYTIVNPMVFHTGSYTLGCVLTLEDDNTVNPDALLTVLGTGTVSVSVGEHYDKNGARELVAAYAAKVLKNGITANAETPQSVNIVGPYGFYVNDENNAIAIAVDGSASLSSGVLTASKSLKYTKTEELSFTANSVTSKVVYRHIGINYNFNEDKVLQHMPATNAIISNDLFLPTSVPGYNASITWYSSDVSVMSTTGRIISDSNDKQTVTLTAVIKVNDTVQTREFTFYVTSNNNQVNFQKLVNDISPVIVKKKYVEGDDTSIYYLPIVSETNGVLGTYDYRTDYSYPTLTEDITEYTMNWTAHENIRLVKIEYAKIITGTAENPIDEYDYITVSGNAVTLTGDTLSNYAKIKIIGTFSNGEVQESVVNIAIALGSDTDLLEKAFNNVDGILDGTSVLGNIIKTRIASGMTAEAGDFYLPATYGEQYTISYEVSSEMISVAADPVTVEGELVYKFTVNPTKFNSVETDIPVNAKVSYKKDEDTTIDKIKVIYITTPAAVHIADMGNISIFNSVKYQVVNTLPTAEKKNLEFSGDSLVTYSGSDYILVRDMVGDVEYLNSYTSDSTYLTLNSYNANGSGGAAGVSTISLYTNATNPTSTTDTLAYDFVKLIQWATGNTKVLVNTVISEAGLAKLSTSLRTYKSNGEPYLNEDELDVLEAFYKACTNDNDGTKWTAIKALALETKAGRIYDNSDLLVTILDCITSEKGINSGYWENETDCTYGKIYAKYLEVVNRYAITTSENEERMSPAQEVYNSKYYYSFTEDAKYSTVNTSTTTVSFPCKYYDASGTLVSGYCNRYTMNWGGGGSGTYQGVYASHNTTGIAAADIYANASGNPYDSDHTKYITSAELMVLKAFWLGALSKKGDATSNNVLKEFTDASKTKIANALAADAESGILPYPKYNSEDFKYYGQAMLNAFDACLVIPTYFTSGGIGLLVNSFYDNFNTTGYKTKTYGDSTDTTVFKSQLISGVPAVTNLDNLEGALTFLSGLTTIDIKGNASLSAFLSDNGLSNAFARIAYTNKKVTTLTMQYVSPAWNTFDVTNLKNLDNLTVIDISNNLGIKTVNPLLNTNRSKYTSVNIYNIGEVYDYNSFVIDNLASSTCEVKYSNVSGGLATKSEGSSSLLVNLSGVEDLVSEHLYLTNVIYNDDGTITQVAWRVEEGNEMGRDEVNSGGALDSIETVNEMNMRVSPYFYCTADFTYFDYNFKQYGLYKIDIDTSNAAHVTPINVDSTGTVTFDVYGLSAKPSEDYDNLTTEEQKNLTTYSPSLTYSGEFSRGQTPDESTTTTIYSQDSTIVSGEVQYTLNFAYYTFDFRGYAHEYASGDGGPVTYNAKDPIYFRADNTNIAWSQAAADLNCYFVLLTQNQADFIVSLRDNEFTNTTNGILTKYGITANAGVITIGTGLPANNQTVSNVYLYNLGNQEFLDVYGYSQQPTTKFDINRQSQNVDGETNVVSYSIYNQSNKKYIVQNKIATKSNGKGEDIGVGYNASLIGNVGSTDAMNFATTVTGDYSQYRGWWRSTTNGTYTKGTVTCTANEPTLSFTSGSELTNTVYFNCTYIRNSKSDTYYYYDVGSFLLVSSEASTYGENAKFCFLTAEDKDKLKAWFDKPDQSITVGSTPEKGKYYYIYCPETRRFIKGGAAGKIGEIYTTVSDFDEAQLYYIYHNGSRYYINAAGTYQGYCTGFNAYGGVENARYVAVWGQNSSNKGVIETNVDHANSGNVFTAVSQQYKIEYSKHEKAKEIVAYQLDYTITKVNSHVLIKDIDKEYQVDTFYYLNADVTIDGIKYKAGSVIRFVVDAYDGKQYEYDVEYYELVLTYYNNRTVRNDTTKKVVTEFKNATYKYYYYTYDEDENAIINYYEDGAISYTTKALLNESYNKTAKYTNHTNQTGVTLTFNDPKLVLSESTYDSKKNDLYLDIEGANSAANATFNENQTYYKETLVTESVFQYEFNQRKNSLYTSATGAAHPTTMDRNATYYEYGYKPIGGAVLYGVVEETYKENTYQFNVFDYYKQGIYKDASGTPVGINETYVSTENYYYFLQPDGTYSHTLPTIYSALAMDYVPLSLNATTFEYYKHTLYTDENGTNAVRKDDEYNVDTLYYVNAYVKSTFFDDVLNEYRNVLYLDSTGKKIDLELTFDSSYNYYANSFVPVTINNASDFNNMKSRLYANQYGKPLASNATYQAGTTYYRKVFEAYVPSASGNLDKKWVTTKKEVTRLYSHAKVASATEFQQYVTDYSNVYNEEDFPTIYKFIGSGSENIYANPTIMSTYQAVRAGTVTADNWDQLKDVLYIDNIGTSAVGHSFEEGRTYYRKSWNTTANLVSANVTYDNNWGYYFERTSATDDTLKWTRDPDGLNSNSGMTMDEILAEANEHFHDNDYNQYYGKHYAYNGFTMKGNSDVKVPVYAADGVTITGYTIVRGYTKGYVYRIIVNSTNTAFIWERVYTYRREAGATMVTKASTGQYNEGDTILTLSACFTGFYKEGQFFRIVEDDFTKTLNVVKFTDVTIANNYAAGYTDITSQKIGYISDGDYLGYAGTYELVISAVERVETSSGSGVYNYTGNVRTYKIKLVGTVINDK